MMMRIAPSTATKAFAFARALPTVSRNANSVSFTALRMMSVAAPSIKVRCANQEKAIMTARKKGKFSGKQQKYILTVVVYFSLNIC
jgi:hypothetical protein